VAVQFSRGGIISTAASWQDSTAGAVLVEHLIAGPKHSGKGCPHHDVCIG
jgi:hypothetical protein